VDNNETWNLQLKGAKNCMALHRKMSGLPFGVPLIGISISTLKKEDTRKG